MKIIFHGHSCFSLKNENFHILIDPFLSGNPLAKARPEDFKNLDAVLITHGHGDHLGDGLEIAKENDCIIIAPNELAVYCETEGAKVHPMHLGGSYQFPFGKVKLTQALHGSAVIDDKGIQYTGNPCGFVITMAGKKVYHAGDTGLFLDMKLIGLLDDLDLALLPIGDNFVMGIDDAVLASKFLNAKINIPMHYDTFELVEQDPLEFKEKAEKINRRVEILEIEESFEF